MTRNLHFILSPSQGASNLHAAWRGAWALGIAFWLVWAQLFIQVHEQIHLGQTDTTQCEFSPVTATLGVAGICDLPVLIPPLLFQSAPPILLVGSLPLPGKNRLQQARAPPTLV